MKSNSLVPMLWCVVKSQINTDLADFYYNLNYLGDMYGSALIGIPAKIIKGDIWDTCLTCSNARLVELKNAHQNIRMEDD